MASRKPRILVIDDWAGTREAYRMTLELGGFDVRTAPCGRDGLALLRSDREFDLVLSDLRMPDGSGFEVLAEVRENGPRIPVVIITAYGTAAISEASKLLGASEYVDGLRESEELIKIVERNLRNSYGGSPVRSSEASPPLGHAARRWAGIVAPLARSSDDIPTISAWAHEVASAPATIKVWCAAAGVPAKASLDLGRALRILTKYGTKSFCWRNALSIVSVVSLDKFLARCGFEKSGCLPNIQDYLVNQRLITDVECLRAINAVLAGSILIHES